QRGRLMNQVREVLRFHHYAYSTEKSYIVWNLQFDQDVRVLEKVINLYINLGFVNSLTTLAPSIRSFKFSGGVILI
ncbi:MAG: hypothetical protein ACKVHQ_10355, partial [Gammaproteobacteria bacterium]